MTYFGVLFTFILPPLMLLLVLVPRDLWKSLLDGQRPSAAALRPYWIVLAHVLLALVYTTAWDNYLVASGVWWYDPHLVTGITLGYVPIEEYIFFVVQTLLTGLWTLAVLRRWGVERAPFSPNSRLRWIASLTILLLWAVSTILLFSGWKPGTYLTLILSWALIPVLMQVAFGADILRSRWRALAISILLPTGYLWLVDAIAIRSGTWTIDPAQTSGLAVAGLAVEEMLFFFMTNLIVACGVTLMLSEGSRLRLQSWLARFHRWQEERKSRNGVQAESGHPSTAWRITVVSWMVVLIATPICIWVFGEQIFPSMAILGVVTQLAAVLSALVQAWPARRVLSALALVAGFTWTVELIGSATGFLFGNYDYTQALQPQLLGVPLVIPLAWAMMLFPSWAVSQIILERKAARLGRYYPLVFAALTGLVFTAWDLYLDPQMVGRGLWVWETPGGYFGIPWANFIGWWLASALITLIIRPGKVPYTPLLLVYTITWIFQAMGLGVFWGQFGPAMTGFLGMGIFCIYAWQNLEVPVSVIIDWLPIRPRSKDRNSPALNSPIAASHPAASKNE